MCKSAHTVPDAVAGPAGGGGAGGGVGAATGGAATGAGALPNRCAIRCSSATTVRRPLSKAHVYYMHMYVYV